MSAYELAQLNIGVIRGPMDSAIMAEFAASLEHINAVADGAPGFVWRLQTDEGNATSIRAFDDENLLLNMSVWRDVESLARFVYRTAHSDFLRRRREWFEHMKEAYLVLWWVPGGHRPTIDEAVSRLDMLRRGGPSAQAFTFRNAFPPPDESASQSSVSFEGECPAT